MVKPEAVVSKLQRFLGKKHLPEMSALLLREKLPNPGRLGEKAKKLAAIKTLASPVQYRQLLKMEALYQSNLAL